MSTDNAPDLLPCIELEPERGPADAAVIWLHGLGADGNDFVPIVPELGLSRMNKIRFVFPHAPQIPVTLNFGSVMPAWYDIRTLESKDDDEAGIRLSASRIDALIARERSRGIAAERIVLAGFSQGGAVTLHTGLRHGERLAGLLILSAYLLLADKLDAERAPANANTPILQCHGTHDPMVPATAGRTAHDKLVRLGYDARYETYPMQHEVCLEEMELIGEWLSERLPVLP